MKFKLDENFGKRTFQVFKKAGHDVTTVSGQNISGCRDQFLFDHCRQEERCLVTMDLDFSNVLRFPPESATGIAVFGPHEKPTLSLLEQLARQFIVALSRESITGRLWIVESDRIRIHQGKD